MVQIEIAWGDILGFGALLGLLTGIIITLFACKIDKHL
jgi:hypothetical protein